MTFFSPKYCKQMIFEKLKVYLVRLGSLKGKVRREILEKRMAENGAQPVGDLSQADIAVTCKEVSESQIERVLGSFRGRVVDSKWITESLSYGKQLDPLAFEIELEPPSCSPAKKIRNISSFTSKINNEELASVFDHLETMVGASVDKKDRFRGMAYRKAASVLRRSAPIRSEEDAENLKALLGPRTIEKIKEFIRTGHVEKEEYMKGDYFVQAKQELMGVWGIGPAKAAELLAQGIDSVEKLRNSDLAILNSNQRTGLEYYEQLLDKMPRREVEEICSVVDQAKKELFGECLELVLCGSYRRGAPTCSDVDLLLSWREVSAVSLSPEATVEKLVAKLSKSGFLVDHFNKKNHHSVFLGICRLAPSRSARRIDIKVWPREAFVTALVHFTGSADYNRRLRLHAKRLGFKLSDTGLRDPQGNMLTFKCEEDLFEALGVEFLPPEQRLSGADMTLTKKPHFIKEEITDISSSSDSD